MNLLLPFTAVLDNFLTWALSNCNSPIKSKIWNNLEGNFNFLFHIFSLKNKHYFLKGFNIKIYFLVIKKLKIVRILWRSFEQACSLRHFWRFWDSRSQRGPCLFWCSLDGLIRPGISKDWGSSVLPVFSRQSGWTCPRRWWSSLWWCPCWWFGTFQSSPGLARWSIHLRKRTT